MRSDLLSKRIYFAGCFALPWLWIVHVLYYHQIQKSVDDNDNNNDGTSNNNNNSRSSTNEGLLNPDDHFVDDPALMVSLTPEEIQILVQKWIKRCKYSAIIVTTMWIGWIIIAQVLRGKLPVQLYMLSSDSQQVTGW